jgi:transcriptional regulator GlxA family with amidase domain
MELGMLRNMTATSATRCIGFVGITALDLIGPLEVFATANNVALERSPSSNKHAYKTLIIGRSKGAFCADSGIFLFADAALSAVPRLDTLIVPVGRGLREADALTAISAWIRRRASGIRRIASVCTGVYALAEAGLLDGCRVTTHWRYAEAVARSYPRLRIDPDASLIKQGRYYTSAGSVRASILR